MNKTQNYTTLYQQGIALIEQLTPEHWTDYNDSDSGITILEQLCYTLTDLGYRAGYTIPDLLTSDKTTLKAFFHANEILPSAPITKDDWRKLMVSYPDISNVWLSKTKPGAIAATIPNEAQDTYYARIEFTDPSLNNRVYRTENQANAAGIGFMVIVPEGDKDTTNPFIVADTYIMDIILPAWHEVDPVWRQAVVIISVSINPKDIQPVANEAYNYSARIDIGFKIGDGAEQHTILSVGVQIDAVDGSTINNNIFEPIILDRLIYQPGDPKSKLEVFDQFNKTIIKVYQHLSALDKLIAPLRELSTQPMQYQAINQQTLAIEGNILVALGTTSATKTKINQAIEVQLKNYFTPEIQFLSAAQLEQSGKPLAEIYQGPLLLSHPSDTPPPILTDQELAKLNIRKKIYAGDLMTKLLQIEGVLAVQNLVLLLYTYGQLTERSESALEIKAPFDKGVYKHLADKIQFTEVPPEHFPQSQYKTSSSIATANALIQQAPSQGEDMEIAAYTPSYEQFPVIYGVGKSGLTANHSPLRHAQAKQLQAYLAIFEQLMADYLARLGQVKSLFAVDERPTYSYALLCNIAPYAKSVFSADYTSKKLAQIHHDFAPNPNQFIRHLLARMGLDITDSLLNEKENGQVLKDYNIISTGRGQGFNLAATTANQGPDAWNSNNISPLQSRLYYFLGINQAECQRKDLVSTDPENQQTAHQGFYLLEHGLFIRADGFIKPSSGTAFHISYVLPLEVPEFQQKQKKIEALIVQETPAHLCIHFYWLTNVKLAEFQGLYKTWLKDYMFWLQTQYSPNPLTTSIVKEAQNALIEFLNQNLHS